MNFLVVNGKGDPNTNGDFQEAVAALYAVTKLHDLIRTHGCRLPGKHHEIYLSDPHRVASNKMKTIIRQPIQISQ